MKIVYVAPRYHTNQVPIIEGWIKQGDEVTFVSQYAGGTEDYSTVHPVIMGYPWWFCMFLWFYKAGKKRMGKMGKEFVIQSKFGPLPLYRFAKIIKIKTPDIVIMRDRSVYNIGVTLLCKIKKIPAILYTQLPLWEEGERKGGVIRWFFRTCTPSTRITPVLGKKEDIKGENKEKAFYVPFVMEPRIHFNEKKYFAHDRINILGVGKYVPQKRHEMLLWLAKDLKNRFPEIPFHLTIVGEVVTAEQKVYFSNMESYIEEHGLENQITLKKNFTIQQVYEEYEIADIFVLPSKGEVASISHLEAMSCSLPVICSDSNGTSCYIKQDQNGYIFLDNEYEDFRGYVERLVVNREKIKDMGKQSYEIVARAHSFTQYKNVIIKIKEQLQ